MAIRKITRCDRRACRSDPPVTIDSLEVDWLAVEMRHLAALEEIATQRSFGRAASRLGYTQSAVSGQVATLEKIVGRRLLHRARGAESVRPTPAGEVLLRHGAAIADQLRRARDDIAALAEGRAGRLRVGITQSVGRLVVPPVVRAFAQDAPGVHVELAEQKGGGIVLERLLDGSIDVAFTALPLQSSQLLAAPLHREDYRVVAPRGHRLDTGAPVSLTELAGERLIFLGQCPSRLLVERRLGRAGVDTRDALLLDEGATVGALVAAGVGIAVVPTLAVAPSPALAELELAPALPPRVVALAWPQERLSPTSRRFVAVAQRVAAPLAALAPRAAPG
jgi:DNA-binding transcriptional LysR family regulator